MGWCLYIAHNVLVEGGQDPQTGVPKGDAALSQFVLPQS